MKFKKSVSLCFSLMAITSYAGQTVHLHNATSSSLNGFVLNDQSQSPNTLLAPAASNALNKVSQSTLSGVEYKRYQQYYHGIKVVGAQVIIAQNNNQNLLLNSTNNVNGQVVKNLALNTTPSISDTQAITKALTVYNQSANGYQVNYQNMQAPKATLQIITNKAKQTLVYLVSFWANKDQNQPQNMHYYIDAHTGKILNHWDNLQNFQDTGPGGNEKVGEYWYGKGSMPYLDVTKSKSYCSMSNKRVRTANLQQRWDDATTKAYRYTCGKDTGQDEINGAYSSINDAQYFGDIIIDMYKDWYDINALSKTDGTPMQLIMRVHYGSNYDNAFWNGKNMTFGDGSDFYPLVSLDVAGHEVSHGFTEQHSGLIYQDQSGSLNEAFSDMAGQTVRAYLLSQNSLDYQKFYPDDPKGKISWGLGQTIMKGSKDAALRYMDEPSKDGNSADCYNPDLTGVKNCKISYRDVEEKARGNQSYIVHTGSGIFNKAFYLLASKWADDNQTQGLANPYAEGVKEAFNTMLLANVKYWTPAVNFGQAACGVVNAANDLGYSTQDVKNVFTAVGVDTNSCNK